MNINLDSVRAYIENIYAEQHKELIFTKRIVHVLSDVFVNNMKSLAPFIQSVDSSEIDMFLQKRRIVAFISERRPEVSAVSDEVVHNIRTYFDMHLSEYTITDICRKSNHPEDSYLYSIVAKKNEEYACWTSWNETYQSLNYGHYSLKSKEAAIDILKEHFHDITQEPDKYGIECTLRNVAAEELTVTENTIRKKGGR